MVGQVISQVDGAQLDIVGRLHLLVTVAPPFREGRGILLCLRRHLVEMLHGMVVHVIIRHLVAVHVGGIQTQLVTAGEDKQRVQFELLPPQVQRERTVIDRYQTAHVHQGVGTLQR